MNKTLIVALLLGASIIGVLVGVVFVVMNDDEPEIVDMGSDSIEPPATTNPTTEEIVYEESKSQMLEGNP